MAQSPWVQFLVTSRPEHLEGLHCFNLEDSDHVNESRNDGRVYVDQKAPQLSAEHRDQIARLGDGNFLILRGICADLPKDLSQVDSHLRELFRLKGAGRDLRNELYQRTWERLERCLNADELDNVHRVLGLLAISRRPLPARTIKEVLGLRPADWSKFKQHASEDIRVLSAHQDATDADRDDSESWQDVYTLYHATFAELVRQELKDDLQEYRKCLIDSCQKWVKELIQGKKKTFENDYALRHLIQHLLEANDWPGLDETLTSLKFIQARFQTGQGIDLLDEYDSVLKKHPGADSGFQQQLKWDDALKAYVESIVDYSRRCTELRRNGQPWDVEDLRDEQKRPPKTLSSREIVDAMRGAGRSGRLRNQTKKADKKEIEQFCRLKEFRDFVLKSRELLNAVPSATTDIARNYAASGPVRAAGVEESKDSEDGYHLRLDNPPPLKAGLPAHIIQEQKCETGSGGHWMTPDARVAVCREGWGGHFLWFRVSGRRIDISDEFLALSLDGHWVVTQKSDEVRLCWVTEYLEEPRKSISIDGSIDSRDSFPFCRVTPDGSLVVFVKKSVAPWVDHQNADSEDDKECHYTLCFWDTGKDELQREIPLEMGAASDLVLSLSGRLVAVQDAGSDWSFYDCTTGGWIATLTDDWLCSDRPPGGTRVEHCCYFEFWSAEHYPRGRLQSADDCLEYVPAGHNKHAELICRTADGEQSPGSHHDLSGIESLSADGRYALRDPGSWQGFQFVDLMALVRDSDADAADESDLCRDQSEIGTASTGAVSSQPTQTTGFDDRDALSDLGLTVDCSSSSGNATCVTLMKSGEPVRQLYSATDRTCGPVLFTADLRFMIVGPDQGVRLVSVDESDRPLESLFLDGSGPLAKEPARQSENETVAPDPEPVVLIDMKTGDPIVIATDSRLIGLTGDGMAVILARRRPVSPDSIQLHREGDELWYWSISERKPVNVTHFSDVEWGQRNELSEAISISPDGRWLAGVRHGRGGGAPRVRLNERDQVRTGEEDPQVDLAYDDESVPPLFTPDGGAILMIHAAICCLRSVDDGRLLGIADSVPDRAVRIDLDGRVLDEHEKPTGLRIEKYHAGKAEKFKPWVTGVRLFDPVTKTAADQVTFRCRGCHHRVELPESVCSAVRKVQKRYLRTPDQIPVLHLPDKAWDLDDGLNFACSNCGAGHRSTPWLIDREP